MGYYSDFDIEVELGDNVIETKEFADRFHEITNYYLDDLFGIKWYDMEKNMQTISKEYPKTVFSIRWRGEQSDDMGILYFWNGHLSGGHAEIVYPKFNPAELGDLIQVAPELLL